LFIWYYVYVKCFTIIRKFSYGYPAKTESSLSLCCVIRILLYYVNRYDRLMFINIISYVYIYYCYVYYIDFLRILIIVYYFIFMLCIMYFNIYMCALFGLAISRMGPNVYVMVDVRFRTLIIIVLYRYIIILQRFYFYRYYLLLVFHHVLYVSKYYDSITYLLFLIINHIINNVFFVYIFKLDGTFYLFCFFHMYIN
jgi:hypothetical protein